MNKSLIYEIITALLIILFIYSGFSKIFAYSDFKRAMLNQPFPFWFAEVLIWFLPTAELIIAFALMASKTRPYGEYAFLILMTFFSLYIAAILVHLFPKVPCTCGDLISSLSWQQHLFFNLFFLLLCFYAIKLRTNKSKTLVRSTNT